MEDELVGFELAKLAKEKGFMHMKANCYGDNMAYQLPEGELINALRGNTVAGYILAPTQSLLQRWIRESHGIIVVTYANASGYCFELHYCPKRGGTHIKDSGISGPNESGCWDSYEQALEEGLKQALKLIEV